MSDAASTVHLTLVDGEGAGVHVPGRAAQVEPLKSMLKAPGAKRLKLKHDKLLSNFGFDFNLHRYNLVRTAEQKPDEALLSINSFQKAGPRATCHVTTG